MLNPFLFALALAAVVPACGGSKDDSLQSASPSSTPPSGAGAAGAPAGAGAGAGKAGSAGAGSAGAGGADAGGAGWGGSASPPVLNCPHGEGLVVGVQASARTLYATFEFSSWTQNIAHYPSAQLAAFIDDTGEFAVLSLDVEASPAVTYGPNAAAFQKKLLSAWNPHSNLLTTPASPGWRLLGDTPKGTSLVRFDASTHDAVEQAIAPASATWTGLTSGASGAVTVVGYTQDGRICAARTEPGGGFADPLCGPPDLVQTIYNGEIPLRRLPQIVTLSGGDQVVFFPPKGKGVLAAATLGKDGWSEPAVLAQDVASESAAATSSRSGDAVVGARLPDGGAAYFRFAPEAGWSGPFALSEGKDGVSTVDIAAAPGVCGDDAVIAFTTYYDAAAPMRITLGHVRDGSPLVEDLGTAKEAYSITIATRRPSGP